MPKSRAQSSKTKKSKTSGRDRHVKVAISIPAEEFERIEAARAELRFSRSEFLLTTVQQWFSEASRAKLAEQYVRGYEAKPELEPSSKVLEAVQMPQLDQESW